MHHLINAVPLLSVSSAFIFQCSSFLSHGGRNKHENRQPKTWSLITLQKRPTALHARPRSLPPPTAAIPGRRLRTRPPRVLPTAGVAARWPPVVTSISLVEDDRRVTTPFIMCVTCSSISSLRVCMCVCVDGCSYLPVLLIIRGPYRDI